MLSGLSATGFPAAALDPGRSATQHLRQVFTESDGLPRNGVWAVDQDAEGFLWIATGGGLARFDGSDFETWNRLRTPPFSSDDIWDLAIHADGSIWLATTEGLVRFTPEKTRRWSTAEGLPTAHVNRVTIDDAGTIFFTLFRGGFGSLKGEELRVFGAADGLDDLGAWGLLPEPDGGLLVSTAGGLYRLDRGRLSRLPVNSQLPSTFVSDLKRSADGSLWLSTIGGGVVKLVDGEVDRVIDRTAGLPHSNVLGLDFDSDGALWVLTMGGGLAKIVGERISVLDDSAGLPSNLTRGFFEDRSGTLWITTSAGLVRLHDGPVTPWTSAEGAPRRPDSIHATDGELYVTSREGLFRRDGDRFEKLPIDLGDTGIEAVLATADGSFWAGVNKTLVRRSGGEEKKFTLPTPSGLQDRANLISAMLEDEAGDVWVGAASGLYRYDGGGRGEPLFLDSDDGLLGPQVWALADAPGDAVWASTSRGLFRAGPGGVERFGPAEGLPDGRVTAFARDADGDLWLGTTRGLARQRGQRFESWTLEQGLPDDEIHGLTITAEGGLWACARRGVWRLELEQLRSGAESPLRSRFYGLAEGLPKLGIGSGKSPPCLATDSGTVWVATQGGLAEIAGATEPAPRPPPSVRISQLTVDGLKRTAEPDGRLDLDAGTRQVTVRLAALELMRRDDLDFRYRLSGDGWLETGGDALISLGELSPGPHVFEAQARVGGQDWGRSESITLVKARKLHQSPLFYGGLAASVIALALSWHRRRLATERRRLEAVQEAVSAERENAALDRAAAITEERARLAGELHDNLAQSFAGIAMQLEAAEDAISDHDLESSLMPVHKARRIARFGLAEARRSVLALQPEMTLRGGLDRALESLAERSTVDGLFHCRCGIEGDAGELPDPLCHDLFRIAQEAVANAARHGSAREVMIHLEVSGPKRRPQK
ncbi:MAG: two-component regulator propeller domain-containing protein [Acidobacteriota bacterium]